MNSYAALMIGRDDRIVATMLLAPAEAIARRSSMEDG